MAEYARSRRRVRRENVCVLTVGSTGDEELIGAFWATLWTVRKRIERATGVFPPEGEAFEAMLEHVLDEWVPMPGSDGSIASWRATAGAVWSRSARRAGTCTGTTSSLARREAGTKRATWSPSVPYADIGITRTMPTPGLCRVEG